MRLDLMSKKNQIVDIDSLSDVQASEPANSLVKSGDVLLFVDESAQTLNAKVGLRSPSAVTFTGTGLNDVTVQGDLTSGQEVGTQIRITVDSTGTTDTVKISFDNGVTDHITGVELTGSAQELLYSVTFTAAAITGHTLNEYWSVTVGSAQVVQIGSWT